MSTRRSVGPAIWTVLLVLAATGCTAPNGGAVGVGLPEGAIDAPEAISDARGYLDNDPDATLWATVSGPFEEVYDAMHPDWVDRPDFTGESFDKAQVWGVQFKVSVHICPPNGKNCQTRDGLRTVFVDAISGEWLYTSTFSPGSNQPLPTPRLAEK